MNLTKEERALIDAAVDVRHHAYAPYSKFQVGAAILLRDGLVVTGANVENLSFGLTICAERNAIGAAVTAGAGPGDIATIAVVTAVPNTEPTTPCGACRQVLAEFGSDETPVLVFNVSDGKAERYRLGDLLPHSPLIKDHVHRS